MVLNLRTQCIFSREKKQFWLKGIWGTIKMLPSYNKFFDITKKQLDNTDFAFAINGIISVCFFAWKKIFLFNLVGVCYRWMFQLNLLGLGFKAFYSKFIDKFRVDLGYSHIFQLNDVSSKLLCFYHKKVYGKKTILVVSVNQFFLYTFIFRLLKLRPQGRYKTHGFNVKKIFLMPILKKKIQKKSYR